MVWAIILEALSFYNVHLIFPKCKMKQLKRVTRVRTYKERWPSMSWRDAVYIRRKNMYHIKKILLLTLMSISVKLIEERQYRKSSTPELAIFLRVPPRVIFLMAIKYCYIYIENILHVFCRCCKFGLPFIPFRELKIPSSLKNYKKCPEEYKFT